MCDRRRGEADEISGAHLVLGVIDERDCTPGDHEDPLLFMLVRVIDVGFTPGWHTDEIHARAFETHAASELRAVHLGVGVPGMGKLL
jgi:hypothetical protein